MPKLSPMQRQKIRKKTKVRELDPSETVGELNIVPFLDIVVNLIMFLLMTTASVLAVVQIDAQLPTLARGVGGGGSEAQTPLNLLVSLVPNGVVVTGSGGKLAPGCTRAANSASNSIVSVRKKNGKYDWQGLTDCVLKVKKNHPDETQVKMTADPVIEYEHFVSAMDAVRHNDGEEVFPEVLIVGGVR